MNLNRALPLVLMAVIFFAAPAQITQLGKEKERFDVDSIVQDFDNRPYFGIFKDNFFAVGTSLNHKPDEQNSDMKFQVSIRQRLTKSILPLHSHLFLSFSLNAMLSMSSSYPLHDQTLNPGIGVQKLIVYKDRLIGKATIMFDHESNGRDGENSRSWNKVALAGSVYLDPRLMVHAKAWIPIIDSRNNKDILKYCGIFQTGAQFLSANKRWVVDVTFVKRQGWNLNFNTNVNVGFRIGKKDNQFLLLNFYDGYGENLLDYNQYHCRLRIGFLIRPPFFSEF